MRFTIIGTGAIAGHFARSIADLEDCELVGVCSSNADRAHDAQNRFGIPAFTDWKLMFQETKPDITCICTQSGRHLEPCIDAAKSGVHVICEKPLEITTQRIEHMIQACDSHGVVLAGIFQNRYSRDFQILKATVDQGHLGRLISGHAYIKWYRSPEYYSSSPWKGTIKGDGGAALINQGIHTVDLLQHVMGEVTEVYAKVATNLHDIEGEDLAQGLLSFANGAMGTIVASTALWPGYPERLEIYGEKGSIFLEGGKISTWNVMDKAEPAELLQQEQLTSGAADPMAIDYQLHRAQIEDIVQDIKAGKTPKIDGREARKAMAIIEAMYHSARKGQTISLVD